MKKTLLLLLLSFASIGCSLDDDDENTVVQVFVPVESVEMPESFVSGETYVIDVTYAMPTDCHIFSGINYEIEEEVQYFAVVNSFDPEDPNCREEEGLTAETNFKIEPRDEESYTFKFWQGIDENGDTTYLTMEVPVITPENEE